MDDELDSKKTPLDWSVDYSVYIENEDGNKELQILLPMNKLSDDVSKAADFVSILIENDVRFRLVSGEGGHDWRDRSD